MARGHLGNEMGMQFRTSHYLAKKSAEENMCPSSALAELFAMRYKIYGFQRVPPTRKLHVLKMCANKSFTLIAVAFADRTVCIYDITGFELPRNEEFNISVDTAGFLFDLQFLNDDHLLLAASTSGQIFVLDVRLGVIVASVRDYSDRDSKPFTCFDANASRQLFCAGTEEINRKAYLSLFDIRKLAQVSVFSIDNCKDITAVKFHKTEPHLLCSGTEDGLLDITDTSKTDGKQALLQTIANPAGIKKLDWNGHFISCITNTNSFRVFDSDTASLVQDFDRFRVSFSARRRNVDETNLMDSWYMDSGRYMLLIISEGVSGQIIRTVMQNGNELKPLGMFNHCNDKLKDCVYSGRHGKWITMGRNGLLAMWNTVKNTQGE